MCWVQLREFVTSEFGNWYIKKGAAKRQGYLIEIACINEDIFDGFLSIVFHHGLKFLELASHCNSFYNRSLVFLEIN